MIDFLGRINTGVCSYQRTETALTEEMMTLRQELFDLINRRTTTPLDFETNDREYTIELAHRTRDGKPAYLDLGMESAGTLRLLMVLSLVYRALDDGVPVTIDELDASLHTLASEAVVQLFCSRETNPNGAQLIATTHDTNLLASQMLRRDQVWFTEKDEYGATLLFPLTEIRTRSGDNFEKGYLQGRYGATTGIRERSRESPDCKDLVTRVEKAEQRAEVQLEKRTEHDDSFGNPSTTAGRLTYEIRLADKRATRSDSQSPPLPPAFGARHLPGRQP